MSYASNFMWSCEQIVSKIKPCWLSDGRRLVLKYSHPFYISLPNPIIIHQNKRHQDEHCVQKVNAKQKSLPWINKDALDTSFEENTHSHRVYGGTTQVASWLPVSVFCNWEGTPNATLSNRCANWVDPGFSVATCGDLAEWTGSYIHSHPALPCSPSRQGVWANDKMWMYIWW